MTKSNQTETIGVTCPSCHNTCDIPTTMSVTSWGISQFRFHFSEGPWRIFCNRCGVRLEIAQSNPKAIHNSIDYMDNMVYGIQLVHLAPDELAVSVWTARRKRLFISYAHTDALWCKPFAEALKQADFYVFFDDGSIGTGADWVRAIGEAIDNCQIFIAILTPDAWASEWVQRELNTAFAARKEIIPILLKDTDVKGLLRSVQWIDVRGKTPEESVVLFAGLLKD